MAENTMTDAQIQQSLAGFAVNYVDAQSFIKWYPPENDYTVTVGEGIKFRTMEDGTPLWFTQLTLCDGVDEAGEVLDGRSFELGFSGKSLGFFKDYVASISGGKLALSIQEAHELFMASVGKVMSITFKLREHQGRSYPQVTVNEVHGDDEDLTDLKTTVSADAQ